MVEPGLRPGQQESAPVSNPSAVPSRHTDYLSPFPQSHLHCFSFFSIRSLGTLMLTIPIITQHPHCLHQGTQGKCRQFLFSQPSSSATHYNIFTEGQRRRAITLTIRKGKKELTRIKKEMRKTLESTKAQVRSYLVAENSSVQLSYQSPHPSHQYQSSISTNQSQDHLNETLILLQKKNSCFDNQETGKKILCDQKKKWFQENKE